MGEDEADVIVLGLGGIGSAAAYWLVETRRPGDRPRAVRARPRPRRVAGSLADHPALLPRRRTTSGSPRRRTRPGPRSSGESGDRLVHPDGRARPLPAGGAHRSRATTPPPWTPAACRTSAGRPMRRCAATRSSGSTRTSRRSSRSRAASPRPRARTPRTSGSRSATAPTCASARASRRSTMSGDEVTVRAGGRTLRAGRLVLCAGPWTNDALAHFGLRLNLDVTREQVIYVEPIVMERFEPERFPIWIWMDEPSYYGFPDLRRAGRQGGTGRGRQRSRLRTRAASSRRGEPPARARVHAQDDPPRRRGASATSRPACTRCRPTAISSSTACPGRIACCCASAPGTRSSSRRSSVACSPSSRSTARRRTTSRCSAPTAAS